MDSTNTCEWLHGMLEKLPLIKFPFKLENLPENGIYFFYEQGEVWGHGGNMSRIVRIGTSKSGNFRSRIKEHFLLDERKMDFDETKPAPRDRSIFRRNIGRALLQKENNPYLEVWELNFTSKENREKFSHLRDIDMEKRIERRITEILRTKFRFRFTEVPNSSDVMGSKGLESSLIGTLAHCKLCKKSDNWLGNFSPVDKIRNSGLWLYQHLNSNSLTEGEKREVEKLIEQRNQ